MLTITDLFDLKALDINIRRVHARQKVAEDHYYRSVLPDRGPFPGAESSAFEDLFNIGRAKKWNDYLKQEGVINPMTYKGMGPTQPVAPNDTEENKAKNRRVEFVVLKE